MNIIPPFDLSEQYKIIGEEINQAVLDVLASGRYIGGTIVETFEKQLAGYVGVSECVSCNSGTDALYLALRALKIGAGDEVITTPFTFVATGETISAVGATPIFVDIDPQTFNLDLSQIAAAINPRTKAIIPVHLFGQPADMTRLMAIANAHHLAVIEDCAQATGAEWAGQKVGSFGQIGCFSFYPTKNLGACGDGGAITTNDPEIAATLRMLRDHGRRSGYYHEEFGVNSRLDAMQAAILQIKLRYLDGWNDQRRVVADRYHQLLQPISRVVTPQVPANGRPVWNQYTVRIVDDLSQPEGEELLRDRVRTQLQAKGVNSMVYYPLPLHLQPIYHSLGYLPGQLAVSDRAAHEVLSLPMFPELSIEQQDQVVYSLKDCLV
ncbi:DegT/DnrJ/EryC1/StrS family aminotransferase [Phormidesmis priestleyi ULC007]|uniref:DegT/DnrJ/EryC1/StrS family aminotransferase n=1 Tax=Phormidesmis priestleyi ULC007 TaxID=1920490 RepID=A0A2T1DMB4_9CYAN|nr:DegT/DnrJ/EryC1/StrS family aminotransferase [Phormidesmis priestleyi]PSB21554.1 DegT/DnrJ/EryC1/StrS family aminotransferase [Phormidesmis priestleyi ULC007]PZO54594.1 MAG: DegT/DnrJ/EryC1/StrS family aminotransferase [Phormidesmis priestleyi]